MRRKRVYLRIAEIISIMITGFIFDEFPILSIILTVTFILFFFILIPIYQIKSKQSFPIVKGTVIDIDLQTGFYLFKGKYLVTIEFVFDSSKHIIYENFNEDDLVEIGEVVNIKVDNRDIRQSILLHDKENWSSFLADIPFILMFIAIAVVNIYRMLN